MLIVPDARGRGPQRRRPRPPRGVADPVADLKSAARGSAADCAPARAGGSAPRARAGPAAVAPIATNGRPSGELLSRVSSGHDVSAARWSSTARAMAGRDGVAARFNAVSRGTANKPNTCGRGGPRTSPQRSSLFRAALQYRRGRCQGLLRNTPAARMVLLAKLNRESRAEVADKTARGRGNGSVIRRGRGARPRRNVRAPTLARAAAIATLARGLKPPSSLGARGGVIALALRTRCRGRQLRVLGDDVVCLPRDGALTCPSRLPNPKKRCQLLQKVCRLPRNRRPFLRM